MGCRLDIGDVLEAALHLGPFAALWAVGARQVVLEGQVLQRQGEDGRARSLAGLGELLQQVWVGVAAVSDRFEVLAELVDDQEQRHLRCQAAGDLDEGCGGRARSARVVRRRVRQGALEGLGRRERAGSGDLAVAAQDGGVQRPKNCVAYRFTVGGDQAPMEATFCSVVAAVGSLDKLPYRR